MSRSRCGLRSPASPALRQHSAATPHLPARDSARILAFASLALGSIMLRTARAKSRLRLPAERPASVAGSLGRCRSVGSDQEVHSQAAINGSTMSPKPSSHSVSVSWKCKSELMQCRKGLLKERQEACLRALKLQNTTDTEAWISESVYKARSKLVLLSRLGCTSTATESGTYQPRYTYVSLHARMHSA